MEQFVQELIRKKLISKEKMGFDQVEKLISRAHQDIKVAEANFSIDHEATYNYAYLSMLRAGRALIFSHGYRPIDGQQHKTTVEISAFILGENYKNLTEKFDRMRRTRNKFTYESLAIPLSNGKVTSAIENAKTFLKKITELIQFKNPQKTLF